MYTILKSIVLTIFIFSFSQGSAYENLSMLEQKEHMYNELEFIYQTFKTGYAPLEWKRSHADWNLRQNINKVRSKVRYSEGITVKEFQNQLRIFFNSVKDYHTGVRFYSTEMASLPFLVRSANGRYFFTYINHAEFPLDHPFPFAVGDELLFFDNMQIDKLVQQIMRSEVGSNHLPTDMALAEIFLTSRAGMLGSKIPQGPVSLIGRKAGSSEMISYVTEWKYVPEMIPNIASLQKNRASMQLRKQLSLQEKTSFKRPSFFRHLMIWPKYEALAKVRTSDDSPRDMLGVTKSFLPPLGKIIWQADCNEFDAYMFELSHGKVAGYVRIGNYKPANEAEAIQEFKKIIHYFEKHADILVVDQLNNPGGYLLYMYALASMLTSEPLLVPQHRQAITQGEVFLALEELSELEAMEENEMAYEKLEKDLQGLHVTRNLVRSLANYLRFLIHEWSNGRQLTDFTYMYGIKHIEPNPIHFSKPFLILINELDFSGGDFFPAIMQDNQRAKVLGTRTAGAGGYMMASSFTNLSGIAQFHWSASIAQRPNFAYIENYGVTPDIPYSLTELDRKQNYVDFLNKIVQTLEEIINKSCFL